MAEFKKVGIVILNYNTYQLTLSLVRDIRSKLLYPEYDIIVVDNASPNESKVILSQASSNLGFIFLSNAQNTGYARGNNAGIQLAIERGADYIIISNNDVIISDNECVDKLIGVLENDESVGVVSPALVSSDGRPDPPLYFKKPSLFDLTVGSLRYHRQRFSLDNTAAYQVYAPRGSFMAMRTSDLKQIGCLDENTFLYFEELILAERLSLIGKKAFHCGYASIIHNHSKTISSSVSQRVNLSHIVDSLRYYLRTYRNFSSFKIEACVLVRKMAFYARRMALRNS